MVSPIKFPDNPFPDVKATDFHKLNKEAVSEDFVEGNFRDLSWKVYKPLIDNGIDRIITKNVCPNGHTAYNENLNGKCTVCDENPIKIIRYVQIKTRKVGELTEQFNFGYTVSPRDFRPDPRHIFLFYSDHTEDFIIISVLEYLRSLNNLNYESFAVPAFKQSNNRVDNLKYIIDEDKWIFRVGRGRSREDNWERFRNIEGIKKIQNPEIDNNLNALSEETAELRNSFFRSMSAGKLLKNYPNSLIKIQEYLTNVKPLINVKEMRDDTIENLSTSLTSKIKNSINKSYWFKYRGLRMP